MKNFGADALFFVPEYLGNVSALSSGLVGIAMGVFVMSWNITTFILHTKRFKFLATTTQPFLKYCINNSILPILLVVFYLVRSYQFNMNKELFDLGDQLLMMLGFLSGFILLLAFSFAFFFGADRTIYRTVGHVINDNEPEHNVDLSQKNPPDHFEMKVGYYFNSRLKLKKARPVQHYSFQFLDIIFKKHHFAAMVAIVLAFAFLTIGGFFLDTKFFEAPAAVSITIFFAIMVAVFGALNYFLQSWSVLLVVVLVIVLNALFQAEIIDTRNKAYGLNYEDKSSRPAYNQAHIQSLCTPAKIYADKMNMLGILEKWKKKQKEEKPIMLLINVSGGGLRSATFVMNTLQRLDSLMKGRLMRQTFMITGASGGMLSAAYYRELSLKKDSGYPIQIDRPDYLENITQDLLNPIFSSMVSRDIFAPAQKFSVGPYRYVKDRGYAFEEKLNANAGGILGKCMKDYVADERSAKIPLMIFNSTISRDGRKMFVSSQPMSFMMKPSAFAPDSSFSPDAIDFSTLFAKQDAMNIRLLTALRMNATFPYVLPNVWLPTQPIVDVMDAGLRDNFGQETTLRFYDYFKDWISQNTSGVVIIQIRDRIKDNWQAPQGVGNVADIIIKPATLLQQNWYKFQDYYQNDQYTYIKDSAQQNLHRVTFMYLPEKEDQNAALNFHLTAVEKRDVIESFQSAYNQKALKWLLGYLR